MCFVHPSTVPQCAVYKSAGVTLSWSSNDWSPSINGTRACGDIDLFWSEQTAPRDFLCHILGLDPDLPRSSLKVEYMQMAIMIRVSGNNYPSGGLDDRNPWCVDDMCLTRWLQNRCSVHWSPCWNIDQRMQDGEKRKRRRWKSYKPALAQPLFKPLWSWSETILNIEHLTIYSVWSV